MSNAALLRYYGFAEFALYFLVALFVALRARSARASWENCFGLFLLWTVPAMLLDPALGRDQPGIAYLIVAPFYAVLGPIMYAVVVRTRPPRPPAPDLDFAAPDSSATIRFLAACGRVAGRVVGVVFKRQPRKGEIENAPTDA